MNPNRTILAATDLSAPARHAADRAARLAQETGAPLALLHALPARPLRELREWLGDDVGRQLQDEARDRLQALADELRQVRQVAVTTELADAGVLDAVDAAATRLDAALIVLGARGAGFLRRLVLGTTAERLLRRTRRPLLVVRSLPHERYRRALLAVDFSPWSADVVALARLAAPSAHLVLCHAWRVPFEEKLHFAGVEEALIERFRRDARVQAEREIDALARAAGLVAGQWESCIVEGEASQRLVEQERAQDCDLVVLGKHGHGVAEDLLLGSVTKHMLAEGMADVLVATLTPPRPAA